MDLPVIPNMKSEFIDAGENSYHLDQHRTESGNMKQDSRHLDLEHSCIECCRISLMLIKHQISSHRTNDETHRRKIFQTLQTIENTILFPSDTETQLDFEIVLNVESRDKVKSEFPEITNDFFDNTAAEIDESRSKSRYKCEICSIDFTTVDRLDSHKLKRHPAHHSIERYSTYNKVLVFLDEEDSKNTNTPVAAIDDDLSDERSYDNYYAPDFERVYSKTNKKIKKRNSTKVKIEEIDGDAKFLCKFCCRLYPSEKRLKIHMKIHSNSRPVFKCDMCYREYFDKDTLRDHLYTHFGIKPYKCVYDNCEYAFSHASGRRQHYKNHHSDGKKSLNDTTNGENLTCDICCRQYPNRKRLLIHLKTHQSQRPLYECTECDKKYLDSSTLRDHMNIHNGESPYKCAYGCGKGFAHSSGRRHHHKACQLIKIKQEGGTLKPLILCDLCGREFRSKNRLLTHLKKHATERPVYKCTECTRTYLDKEAFRDHKNTHTGERPFECSFGCGKNFTHASIKRQHEKRHKPEERLMCEICSRLLKSKASYMDHMRTHTGEHPFPCTYSSCDKTFKSKKSLSKHCRMRHSNNRPFKCERCNLGFLERNKLNAHLKRKTLCSAAQPSQQIIAPTMLLPLPPTQPPPPPLMMPLSLLPPDLTSPSHPPLV